MSGDRHDMSDAEWEILRSVLPRKQQGPRWVHDSRVMNGIFFVLRTCTPWHDLPERYGPYTNCFNRYNRWCGNGTWASIMGKLQGLAGNDGGDDGPARRQPQVWGGCLHSLKLECACWHTRARQTRAGGDSKGRGFIAKFGPIDQTGGTGQLSDLKRSRFGRPACLQF